MKKNILKSSALVLAGAIAITACKKPEATFTASTTTPMVGEYVVFTDGQEEKGMKKLEYTYDFGDGTQMTGVANPSHAYDMAGTYKVTQQIVKAKNEQRNGRMAVASTDITVSAAAAAFESSATAVAEGQSLMFTNKTDDTKGSPVSYLWVVYNEVGATINSTSTKDLAWTPNATGKYKVVLWAMQGASKTMKDAEVTVTGGNGGNAALASFLSGKFTYTMTASGSSCVGDASERYSSIWLEAGNPGTGVVTFPSSASGNVETISLDIDIINGSWVDVNGSNGMGSNTSAQAAEDGLYEVTSASASSVVLTRKNKTNCVASEVTNTFTITLTRQ